ncbi:hypothetical protein HDF26_000914 [Pedobacter cryoconitis]|uniref:hypothetical protein n=1 Tax=Pedobacter cryoconitis TaxID=188932 RepID=UPI001618BA8E|nr:hypothetical protein [Pedobacter cryoconitis]MBB6270487.1 hypothetical protein [Pedobacter cryoconitis]
MEKKRKKPSESDTHKAMEKAGGSKPEKPKTDEPLAEKDEVKQAEENMRKHVTNEHKAR